MRVYIGVCLWLRIHRAHPPPGWGSSDGRLSARPCRTTCRGSAAVRVGGRPATAAPQQHRATAHRSVRATARSEPPLTARSEPPLGQSHRSVRATARFRAGLFFQSHFPSFFFSFVFQMVHFITSHADKIESIHLSDQFSGPKVMQEYVLVLLIFVGF